MPRTNPHNLRILLRRGDCYKYIMKTLVDIRIIHNNIHVFRNYYSKNPFLPLPLDVPEIYKVYDKLCKTIQEGFEHNYTKYKIKHLGVVNIARSLDFILEEYFSNCHALYYKILEKNKTIRDPGKPLIVLKENYNDSHIQTHIMELMAELANFQQRYVWYNDSMVWDELYGEV